MRLVTFLDPHGEAVDINIEKIALARYIRGAREVFALLWIGDVAEPTQVSIGFLDDPLTSDELDKAVQTRGPGMLRHTIRRSEEGLT